MKLIPKSKRTKPLYFAVRNAALLSKVRHYENPDYRDSLEVCLEVFSEYVDIHPKTKCMWVTAYATPNKNRFHITEYTRNLFKIDGDEGTILFPSTAIWVSEMIEIGLSYFEVTYVT